MKKQEPLLISRKEFKAQVLARSNGKCVFCEDEAVDAHHILDRSLFGSGGCYLDNGVAVCEKHHWECEKGNISPRTIREWVGIKTILLPLTFDVDRLTDRPYFSNRAYDKWGIDSGEAYGEEAEMSIFVR